jgi:hypothetical protein
MIYRDLRNNRRPLIVSGVEQLTCREEALGGRPVEVRPLRGL